MRGAHRELALPTSVFWAANIVAAVLFGLGHLPATAAVAPLSAALLVRAVVLSGAAGLVFGELYKRHGLEWAMASHFGVDNVALYCGAGFGTERVSLAAALSSICEFRSGVAASAIASARALARQL